MKKEIPILFKTPMVQSTLDSRKTNTRRTNGLELVNENPDYYEWLNEYNQLDIPRPAKKFDDRHYYAFTGRRNNYTLLVTHCPYGKPGDLLYVRESWRIIGWDFDDCEITIEFKDGVVETFQTPDGDDDAYDWIVKQYENLFSKGIIAPSQDDEERIEFTGQNNPFKPPIHLPKWCSRIWLEVTQVRPERLQDISDKDAIAEGIELVEYNCFKNYDEKNPYQYLEDPIGSFRSLWQSIHGPGSWEANPWVWVVEFKVLSTTGKPLFKNLKHIDA